MRFPHINEQDVECRSQETAGGFFLWHTAQ